MSNKSLYDVLKELQNGTAHTLEDEDVKPLMFPLVRVYYPYIPISCSLTIMKSPFPLNWKLLKSLANGVKYKGMYKKVSKDDNIVSIYNRKSDLGLKHIGDVCKFYETDIKTLNMMSENKDTFKEIKSIDDMIDKMLKSEDNGKS